MDKWSEEQLKKMKVGRGIGRGPSGARLVGTPTDPIRLGRVAALTSQLGGNEAFKSFIESYGSEGGYTKGIGMQEKYNSWAAAQYRDKVG